MKSFFSLILFILAGSVIWAQNPIDKTATLPRVFILGEHAKAYDALTQQYSHHQMLLDKCNNDMAMAYGKWMSMLKEMEAYASQVNYNLDGLKLWLNVFFDKDGHIEHIAFYPKTASRVVPLDELKAFFKKFAEDYKFPLQSDEAYVHFGHAAFPTAPKPLAQKQADTSKKN